MWEEGKRAGRIRELPLQARVRAALRRRPRGLEDPNRPVGVEGRVQPRPGGDVAG